MKKGIRNIVIVLYAIIAIFVTICLLSYNEYNVTVFGNSSFIIVANDKLNPEYHKGDLIIVDGSKEVNIGDKIFFYNAQAEPTLGEVKDMRDVTPTQTTYTLKGDKPPVSGDYLIGLEKDIKVIKKIGTILGILESKWGFLLLVVLPAVIAFLYEIFEVYTELKGKKKDEENRGRGRRH